ncbi:cysteine dioxygenase family protein [Glycomyces sp. TRM65418]|uniref:cysteine dioxygenase n=1 Tax=Glycomyces sp. TRM65418 TaxID=2867006 RepID=UPI001CE5E782|nr:cysteine dioxygenase family protein [Glycomyces sp. TRM65418]MCC3764647.1 cysteine dioxygenase family protein [Glycomyces sp. TRM65418]QZD54309.1 cysteine dioxygenase family protein [Glycomyces sp. TRM65418]
MSSDLLPQSPPLAVDRLESLAAFYAANLTLSPRFTKGSRWARRVLSGPGHEAWLLAWLPGQGTDLHDHGGVARPAAAAVAVVSGRLTEYTVQPGDFPGLRRRHLTAGEVAVVDDRTVHGMRNVSDGPAVSLHVYAPGLEAMRTYLLDETGLAPSRILRAGEDW